ncbi:MAG: Uma2 family endonuclease [Anaerolineae bacterium]|nr:Uma2 family endonuclease [Anaerolineae bacterium]
MVQERQKVDAATFDVWVAEQPENRLFELVHGEVFEKPMVTQDGHGIAVSVIISYLTQHLIANDLNGYVTGETSGYLIGNKRCIPDGALVLDQSPTGEAYSTNTPTLIIEIISNDESNTELRALALKREIYLDAGMVVWEGSTEGRYVDVFTPDGHYRRVRDSLTLETLPGLEIPLGRVFR